MDEGRLGRHRSLLKIRQPLRQVQGHRLLAIRQAQKERVLTTVIALDRKLALPKVRAALGRRPDPAFQGVLDAVALRTLEHRLMPLVEADVRLELKERADDEALRFLSQHLRQVLLTPPLAHRAVAGVDVNAKGDWTVAVLDAEGLLVEAPARIETTATVTAPAPEHAPGPAAAPAARRERPGRGRRAGAGPSGGGFRGERGRAGRGPPAAAAPAADGDHLDSQGRGGARRGAEGGARAGGLAARRRAGDRPRQDRARGTAAAARRAGRGGPGPAACTSSTRRGLSSYANSELARTELSDCSVPQRMAVSLGRRLQDPLNEILKVDPRHLGLGAEQGLVSKANLRRMFDETIESSTAHVGCDVNRAPLSFLAHVPGLDRAGRRAADRARASSARSRAARSCAPRGCSTEAQWTSAVAFLRVPRLGRAARRDEPAPRAVRPRAAADRVPRAARVEDSLGRPGVTKGLRRADFDIDEATWRDLMREIWHPGRDPRPRLFHPHLLAPEHRPRDAGHGARARGHRLQRRQLRRLRRPGPRAGRHDPHQRDLRPLRARRARAAVSIGQAVRARIVDAGGQRIALSLRNVPTPERGPRGRGRGRGERPERAEGGRGERGRGGRGERRDSWDEPAAPVRAAQTRRDGLAGAGGGRGRGGPGGRGRGGPGGSRGPGRGAGAGRDRSDRRDRDASVRPEDLRTLAQPKAGYNPFAKFFKGAGGEAADPARDSGPERDGRASKDEAVPPPAASPAAPPAAPHDDGRARASEVDAAERTSEVDAAERTGEPRGEPASKD